MGRDIENSEPFNNEVQTMRWFTTTAGFEPIDLIQFGIDHLASAKVLFDTGPRCYDAAGYLSQLGIELLLKALILCENGQFPDEHNLTRLHSTRYLPRSFPVLSQESADLLNRLDRYYQLRYPRRTDPVAIGSEDWGRIEGVYEELHNRIPHDIMEAYDKKNPGEKGGRILMEKPVDGPA
jgi:HEPN domain-containing protein